MTETREETVVSDVVSELRALLVEYETVDPARYFARQERWDMERKIHALVFPHLPALLDVADTLRSVGEFAASHSGRDGGEVTLAALYRIAEESEAALARLDGEESL